MNRKSKRIAATETGSNSGHTCEFEVLPSTRKPKAIYVIFDGRRIAYRDAGAWVSMVPGFEVRDEAHDKLTGLFEGKALQQRW